MTFASHARAMPSLPAVLYSSQQLLLQVGCRQHFERTHSVHGSKGLCSIWHGSTRRWLPNLLLPSRLRAACCTRLASRCRCCACHRSCSRSGARSARFLLLLLLLLALLLLLLLLLQWRQRCRDAGPPLCVAAATPVLLHAVAQPHQHALHRPLHSGPLQGSATHGDAASPWLAHRS